MTYVCNVENGETPLGLPSMAGNAGPRPEVQDPEERPENATDADSGGDTGRRHDRLAANLDRFAAALDDNDRSEEAAEVRGLATNLRETPRTPPPVEKPLGLPSWD